MEKPAVDWSRLFEYRERIHRRYREIWDVPLIKRRKDLFRRTIRAGMDVLDVGAGMRGAKEEMDGLGLKVSYRSMDIDRSQEHDYYSLDEVSERFDVVMLFEVIEHLSLDEGLGFLRRFQDILKPGGAVILSTPNIFNPSRYMRDSSHKTFYAYDELCGLLSMAGFEVEALYRSYNDAFHRYLTKVYLFGWLFRMLSIDYAYSIFAVARKQ
jgi:2-polyprenyl-3-methyl-5-hydroxy-6-metoxy-1,4-benzoquinol methylase